MEDKHSKTEDATPKRLRDARKKGQVAKSQDLNAAVSFLVFLLFATVLSQYLFTNGYRFLTNALNRDYSVILSRANSGTILFHAVMDFALIIIPFILIALVISIGINLVQVGFISSVEPIKPKLNRINPIQGFKNIFSKKALFNFVKNLLKLILVFYITVRNVRDNLPMILNSGNLGTEKLFPFMMELMKTLITNVAIILLGLAIVDLIFQRRSFKKDQMMTKHEIKEEHKEMEGNPEIKSARAQRQREISMSRMMSDIEGSTVVITNPTHIAVVLRYDGDRDEAPIVTAKGADLIAEKIKEVAKTHDIPIMENKPLARSVYNKVEIGQYVPMELYKAVAEILAIVYQMREKRKGKI